MFDEVSRDRDDVVVVNAGSGADWRAADRALRRLTGRRAALDEEEARWLLIARQAEVHVHRGFATFLEYLERVLGHAPHAARERLRVAEVLARLPATRAAMASGRVGYSAVRELTRVATAETEGEWLTAVADKTVREIEAAVAGRKPGDRPETPPDPAHAMRTIRLDLSPSTFALFAAARRDLEESCGQALTDDDVMAALCRGMTAASHVGHGERPISDRSVGLDSNRPPHQIAITTCADCGRAWQDAAGLTVEISATELEQAGCDSVDLGRVDRGRPGRVTRSIPPATRRAVMRRDRGRCVAPGCRGSRFVDVHHLVPRAAGGDHDPSRLAVLCSTHHRAAHAGRLVIEGTAPHRLRFQHPDGRPYGTQPGSSPGSRSTQDHRLETSTPSRRRPGPSATTSPGRPPAVASTSDVPFDDRDAAHGDARRALVGLGFSAAVARDAVERARSHVGRDAPLPALLAAALRECPRPRA